jgi:hypothetical protein
MDVPTTTIYNKVFKEMLVSAGATWTLKIGDGRDE